MTRISLIIILFALPIGYIVLSYVYLMVWHRKLWLFDAVMHEDGRHTLWGALTYWGHFLACLPTALFVSGCLAGGTLIATNYNIALNDKAWTIGFVLIALGFVFVLAVVWGAVRQVGIQQTLHYALQKFERDNVSSWGGCWNQFVPSNVVIGLGSAAAGLILGASLQCADAVIVQRHPGWWAQWLVLGLAVLWFLVLCLIFRTGRRSYTEPRWLAHSIREIATYPLTAVPAGLGAILLAHYALYPEGCWNTTVPLWSVGLFVIACILVIWQLLALRGKDVIAMSQKPSFAPEGLPVTYLLASHVFEHTTDIIFVVLTTPGFYVLGLSILGTYR